VGGGSGDFTFSDRRCARVVSYTESNFHNNNVGSVCTAISVITAIQQILEKKKVDKSISSGV
jgi:hypothetical protein